MPFVERWVIRMKKIGIITICDIKNYGNQLQNYAVQKTLSKLGLQSETILNYFWDYRSFKERIKDVVKRLKKDINTQRYLSFKRFNRNIKTTKIYNSQTFKNIYDYYIVGSDQVWNYEFAGTDFYFAPFSSCEKKISYAASFGVSSIPNNQKDYYREHLLTFKEISVREEAGAEIVKDLTGKEVTVLIDPTMMLSTAEWDKVAKKPRMLKTNRFILNYFLGDLSEQKYNEIKRIAKENGCEIINILDRSSVFYECGPSEFLYLEKHAFLICTDSFHSSVFAFLYNRPFIIFKREEENVENMYSRIDTLLKKFHIQNREYNGISIIKENLDHDYTEGYTQLEIERKKALKFLRESLD